MIKKNLVFAVLLVLCQSVLFAQDSGKAAVYEQRYLKLVEKVGVDGVGVETVLNHWENADSTSSAMLMAKFSYYFNKSYSNRVVSKTSRKYLGNEPLFSLKDSTGTDVYYFEEPVFDDEIYGKAIQALDKAIRFYPIDMDYRFLKADAYMAYEKDSPDMAVAYLLDIVRSYRSKPNWKYEGKAMDDELFAGAMQEYCHALFSLASPNGYEAFKSLSEAMLKLFPKELMFMNNLGSYHLAVGKNCKKAISIFNKVLKKDPSNNVAIRNCIIAARNMKDVKAEKKYLRMYIKYGPENEKTGSQARLDYLENNR